MTENEAIERLEALKNPVSYTDVLALYMGIKAIEEIQQYRAIGTVEEFKTLKEKRLEAIVYGKWIDTQPNYHNVYYKNAHMCSNCRDYYTTEYEEMKFCPNCGAKMQVQD